MFVPQNEAVVPARAFLRDNSLAGRWLSRSDFQIASLALALVLTGYLVAFQSPESGIDPFRWGWHAVLAVSLALAVSLLPMNMVRLLVRVAVFPLLLVASFLVNAEEHGGRRWLTLEGTTFQPSEFLKVALALFLADMLACGKGYRVSPGRGYAPGHPADLRLAGVVPRLFRALVTIRHRDGDAGVPAPGGRNRASADGTRPAGHPVPRIAALAAGLLSALAMYHQNDNGSLLVVLLLCLAQFILSGGSWRWIPPALLLGLAVATAVYAWTPHVRHRVDGYLCGSQTLKDISLPWAGRLCDHPEGEAPDNYQARQARDVLKGSGWFGAASGSAVHGIPVVWRDFTFVALMRKLGVAAGMVVIAIYFWMFARILTGACRQHDPFARVACGGIVTVLASHTLLHMGVNTGLLPVKGVPLPFMSPGGSSLVAAGVQVGLAMVMTRQRPLHVAGTGLP